MFRSSFAAGAAGAALLFSIQSARGAVFAQYVPGTYTQGTVPDYLTSYNNAAALGSAPQGITGVPAGFPGVVSPFNPPFDTSQIVLIGLGGQVTVQFAQPIPVQSGPQIGIFSNVGLIDINYPSGQADNPAGTFGGGQAVVSVSSDGKNWSNLGVQTFNNPENFYLNAGPYDVTAPDAPQLADFGKPFTGSPTSFDNENYQQMLTTLNGSAGGTWLDVSGSGLSSISFVRFVEDANQLPAGSYVALEAVSAADSVPEPASAGFLLVSAGWLLKRRIK